MCIGKFCYAPDYIYIGTSYKHFPTHKKGCTSCQTVLAQWLQDSDFKDIHKIWPKEKVQIVIRDAGPLHPMVQEMLRTIPKEVPAFALYDIPREEVAVCAMIANGFGLLANLARK